MASAHKPEPMPAETATRLTEFARACKAATRIVSLYPPSHPSIQSALSRIVAAGEDVTRTGPFTMTVLPDTLQVGGQSVPRADAAVAELAGLLHRHLVGELTVQTAPGAEAWHTLLSLLARPAEDIRSTGGITAAWQAAGGGPIAITEIDYAEVLRERADGRPADELTWDDLIAACLAGDPRGSLDEQTLASLLEIARDEARLTRFLTRLQERGRSSGMALDRQKASLLKILHGLANYVADEAPDEFETVMNHLAAAATRLTPDLMLSLLTDPPPRPGSPVEPVVDLGGELQSRITDELIGEFVAESVGRDRGATRRLAEAFHALAPEEPRRSRALDKAAEHAALTPFAGDSQFESVWSSAVSLLMSYSDTDFVPDDYGRELTGARAQAIEVDRAGDDPPDRIAAWLATVGDEDLRTLDQQLLIDLLRIEDRQDAWSSMFDIALARLEQLVLTGDVRLATALLEGVSDITRNSSPFAPAARAGLSRLTSGPIVKHLVTLTRQIDDAEMPMLAAFCQGVGPGMVVPLAQALAFEESRLSVRRLKDVLVGFGEVARGPARELRTSSNPAVRRAAVELLRAVGGDEALSDLQPLLDDDDPQVQREALRGIIQIGTDAAYRLLEAAIKTGVPRTRSAVMQALGALRDERAAPLLVYILEHSGYRGALEPVYLSAIDALGRSATDERSAEALRTILYRGEWWAPSRTARLREAAARALAAMGVPASDRTLEEAAARGPRGARAAAAQALAAPRRPRAPGGAG